MTSTNDYAEKNRSKKPNMYKIFKLTPDEMMHYLGCLLLLNINSVRNYHLAWSKKSSQHLTHLHQLLTRDRFEAIGAFLHIVTEEEEGSLSSHKLKKILPLHDVIKKKCLELYQPQQQLSVDERMVKSKARTQFCQYIHNKPTKWGYMYLVWLTQLGTQWILTSTVALISNYHGKVSGTMWLQTRPSIPISGITSTLP